jgi:hypothetical protein
MLREEEKQFRNDFLFSFIENNPFFIISFWMGHQTCLHIVLGQRATTRNVLA